jgi:hypothetical protein
MIEVFKTNIASEQEANRILSLLTDEFPGSSINFDLEDCDRILRIKSSVINPVRVIALIISKGYFCKILDG